MGETNPPVRHFFDSRPWRFAKVWGPVFVVAAGLVATVVALTPVRMTAWLSVLAILSCAAVATVVALLRLRSLHLPVEDILPCCRGEEGRLIVCCPYSNALASAANHLASRFYGRETIPLEQYRRWLDKNPDILVCLLDPAGELLGYFDLLPLKRELLHLFADGRLGESDIDGGDILAPVSARRCRHLYFSGIAVKDPDSLAGKRNASVLVWAFARYLEHFYPLSRAREISALASTPQGEALLRRFGFRVVSPASTRKDQHNFYALEVSTSDLKSITTGIRSWDGYCIVGWERRQGQRVQPSTTLRRA